MISSTAKVAMPAADSDSRMSGPARRANTSDQRGEKERRDVADGRIGEEAEEFGIVAGLLLDRDGENARRPGSHGDERDVAERQDARVPDEDVERDDDRDRDERVDGRSPSSARRTATIAVAATSASGARTGATVGAASYALHRPAAACEEPPPASRAA